MVYDFGVSLKKIREGGAGHPLKWQGFGFSLVCHPALPPSLFPSNTKKRKGWPVFFSL